MDLCIARVMQGGDNRQIFQINERTPKTYAEIVLLRVLHGGEAYVTHVKKVGETPDNFMHEKARLKATYGDVADEVFPGINPNMLTDCSGDEFLLNETAESPPPRTRGKAKPDATGFPA